MNREGKNCVLYSRVSTEMQVDGFSLEGQLNRMKTFADREEIPKTLIFAKDDSHADDIIRIAKEVFGEGDDFIKIPEKRCYFFLFF